MTLVELARELGPDTAVVERNPWLTGASVQQQLLASCLTFTPEQVQEIAAETRHLSLVGNSLLRTHCEKNRLDKVRHLSIPDARALATAQVLGAKLATDEWPLTLVAERATDVPAPLTSLAVVHLMELDNKISREERIKVVGDWVKHGEYLPSGWQKQYLELFGEAPPTGQS